MQQLNVIANYYYNFGFNITHISLGIDSQDKNFKSTILHWDRKLKEPSHEWESYKTSRQSLSVLNSFDWKQATGLGVILGYNNLRALDIDECDDSQVIAEMLNILKLPKDYEWVAKSGSKNGFHIIFYANGHCYKTIDNKIKAFSPNATFEDKFKHIELRWQRHLVLPPSKHPTFNQYEFLNHTYPFTKPLSIEIKDLEKLVQHFCKLDNTNVRVRNASGNYIEVNKAVSGQYIEKDDNVKIINSSGNYIEINKSISEQYLDEDDNSQDVELFEDEYDDLSGQYIEKTYYLFFDTETTGLPINWNLPASNVNNWPRLVQLAYLMYDENGKKIQSGNHIIKPNGFVIPTEASNVHKITTERALREGKPLMSVLQEFNNLIQKADCLVAHNISFDEKVIGAEFIRNGMTNSFVGKDKICTMEKSKNYCAIKSSWGDYKWPKLSELHYKLFATNFSEAHNAAVDIDITAKCFWELKKRNII
jgi:DNA polymerase III epsilon subunit-like protein